MILSIILIVLGTSFISFIGFLIIILFVYIGLSKYLRSHTDG